MNVTGSPAGNQQLGQHRAHMPLKMGTLQQGLHARRPRTQRPGGTEYAPPTLNNSGVLPVCLP